MVLLVPHQQLLHLASIGNRISVRREGSYEMRTRRAAVVHVGQSKDWLVKVAEGYEACEHKAQCRGFKMRGKQPEPRSREAYYAAKLCFTFCISAFE